MNFEQPLTLLVWLTSIVSRRRRPSCVSLPAHPRRSATARLWWKLSTIITCGTLAGAIIPEVVKVFTSTESGHVRRSSRRRAKAARRSTSSPASPPVTSAPTGWASSSSSSWASRTCVSQARASQSTLDDVRPAAVFAFGLVAFGFLGMGPVTIAVDSYGPVTDNAQSVYELSLIETIPDIKDEIKKDFGFDLDFEKAKHFLEENDGAGNTFKATAKPVLIGTAVVGATTMIFSIIMALTNGLTRRTLDKLSMLHPPFLLGLITGGAVIYWFTGASTQAVSTGAYRAVEFIKANIKLDRRREGVDRGLEEGRRDLHALRAEGHVQHLPRRLLLDARVRLPRAVLLHRLPHLDRALRPLPGASSWRTPAAPGTTRRRSSRSSSRRRARRSTPPCVVGDTVGDPFKDTSSVALNPVIKFTTLFGLLAVELAIEMSRTRPA